MPRLAIDDFDLYYEVEGTGPAVVFLHGAGGNHMSWWRQIASFARRYTCITLDHRAFGISPDTPDGPGRRAFASDLKALLDHLQIGEVAVIAHSMGGRTAAGLTLRVNHPVWALVLSGTHGGVLTNESRAIQEALKERMDGRSLRERALAPGFVEREPELTYLYKQINRLNPPRPQDFLAPIPGYIGSTREAFGGSGIPILFVVGSEDEVIAPEVIVRAAAELPNAELAVIEGAGHSSYFECPGDFNASVIGFLDRHRPAQTSGD